MPKLKAINRKKLVAFVLGSLSERQPPAPLVE